MTTPPDTRIDTRLSVEALERYSREGSLGAHDSTPAFELQLGAGDAADTVLQVLEVVRRVPGKRLVCRARWQGQEVFAKCFIGAGARKYAARDSRGVQWLAEAGIATPALLHDGATATGECRVLIYAAIAAANAEQVYRVMAPAQRQALALQLVSVVAQHHAAGLLQTDLYLKNFLVQGELSAQLLHDLTIYSLDGDGIRRLCRLRRRQQQLDNLARLISKFDVEEVPQWLPALLQRYADASGWALAPDLAAMQSSIARHKARELQQYGAKVLRNCSDVRVERRARAFIAINRSCDSAALKIALQAPDAMLDAGSSVRLKSGNTCTVAAVEVGKQTLVLKRYNIKNFWHGLGRALRPSRAVQSWVNAYKLLLAGVTTPLPIAVLEQRRWGLRLRAFLLTAYTPGPDAVEFFASNQEHAALRQQVALAIAQLFYRLYLLRLEHGDFKASNLLIVDGQPLLIDLDSMRQHDSVQHFQARHARDLRRFMHNWSSDDATRLLLSQAFYQIYPEQAVLRLAKI